MAVPLVSDLQSTHGWFVRALCLVPETCQIWQIIVGKHLRFLLQPIFDAFLQPCSDHPTTGVGSWLLWHSTPIPR